MFVATCSVICTHLTAKQVLYCIINNKSERLICNCKGCKKYINGDLKYSEVKLSVCNQAANGVF